MNKKLVLTKEQTNQFTSVYEKILNNKQNLTKKFIFDLIKKRFLVEIDDQTMEKVQKKIFV